MTVFEWSIQFLNSSSFLYLLSFIMIFISIARTGSSSIDNRWGRGSGWVIVAAFCAHTIGLLLRWYIGGLDRPPWTNLYESLVFFAWGVVACHLIIQKLWRFPILSAVTMPLVFVLMGMAVLTPNKELEPLIPALQSYWLKIHVVFGMIAYGGFTVAACIAFLHLMKNKVSLSKIAGGVALMTLLNLGIAGGSEVFSTGSVYLAKTATRTLDNGKERKVKDAYRDYEGGPIVIRMQPVKYVSIFFWLSFLGFVLCALMAFIAKMTWQGVFAKVFYASLGFFNIFAIWIVVTLCRSTETTFHANPYLFMLLFSCLMFLSMFGFITWRYEKFLEGLPSAERLDELSYKNILFAFPFQTLLLITGAVWAYYAWGRSWGWDPKETWALITWLAFLIYLHGKLLMRWKSNTLSTLAIIGFALLVFAFLGVNLVLSGLHSYGAA